MERMIPVFFAVVLFASSLAGSGGCGGCNDNGGDSTRPTILSVSPTDGSTGVPLTTTITATFSEAMNATSVNETTFTIEGATGTVSYEGTTATLTPSADLAYNTTFTVTVTTGVKDIAGNSMAADYIWNFTTGLPYSGNTAGALDLTFGSSGIVTTDIGNSYDYAQALALQSDGKIVAAGYGRIGGNEDFALARYLTTGTLDTSFNTSGIVTTAIGSFTDEAYDLGIQEDGKIVVAGRSNNGTNDDFALARYNSNGTLDSTFGSNGITTTAFGSANDIAWALGIQEDGKIVLAGQTYNGANYDFAMARYLSDGTLDSTFGTAGTVTTAIGSGHDYVHTLGIQTDGKIVLAGEYYKDFNYYYTLARYFSDGTLDPSFGSAGITTTAVGSGGNAELHALALQTDGKIVVAGYSFNSVDFDFTLVRYNTNGTLDATFGTAGIIYTDSGNGNDYPYALAIQTDGKIIAAGSSNYDFALARYFSDGTLDPYFGNGGIAITAIGNGFDYALALGIQTDGKIVAAGFALVGSYEDFALARYWP